MSPDTVIVLSYEDYIGVDEYVRVSSMPEGMQQRLDKDELYTVPVELIDAYEQARAALSIAETALWAVVARIREERE